MNQIIREKCDKNKKTRNCEEQPHKIGYSNLCTIETIVVISESKLENLTEALFSSMSATGSAWNHEKY